MLEVGCNEEKSQKFKITIKYRSNRQLKKFVSLLRDLDAVNCDWLNRKVVVYSRGKLIDLLVDKNAVSIVGDGVPHYLNWGRKERAIKMKVFLRSNEWQLIKNYILKQRGKK